MPALQTTNATEGAIWSSLLQLGSEPLSLAAARFLLRLDFPPDDKDRMHELAAKACDGSLSAAEQEDIRNYERVGNLLALMKSKARQRLPKTPSSNGSDFRLFAHGIDFDPTAFLASTPLKFDGVWHKGESGPNHPESSGVFKVLGDGEAIPGVEQELIAIDYLSANREALKALVNYPGVTTFILGLHVPLELSPGTIGFCMGPSPCLMWHALDIGISPMFYVNFDREWEGKYDAETEDGCT